jgi:hypothetical protein
METEAGAEQFAVATGIRHARKSPAFRCPNKEGGGRLRKRQPQVPFSRDLFRVPVKQALVPGLRLSDQPWQWWHGSTPSPSRRRSPTWECLAATGFLSVPTCLRPPSPLHGRASAPLIFFRESWSGASGRTSGWTSQNLGMCVVFVCLRLCRVINVLIPCSFFFHHNFLRQQSG